MATEYGKRLKQARKHAKLTQVALFEKTGIPQSTISTAEREGQGSRETAVYADACGVNALWLASGKGGMLDGVAGQKTSAEIPHATPTSPEANPLAERRDRYIAELDEMLESFADLDHLRIAYTRCMAAIQQVQYDASHPNSQIKPAEPPTGERLVFAPRSHIDRRR